MRNAAIDRARAIGLSQKVLRAVQVVFALVVLACASAAVSFDGKGWWKFNAGPVGFLLFVSVISLLASAFFLAVSWMEQLHQKVAGAVETGVSSVFILLWLASSFNYLRKSNACNDVTGTTYSAGYDGYDEALQVLKDYCAVRSAAVAFGFMTWVLWMASTALAALELRARRGLPAAGPTSGGTQLIEGGHVKSVATPGMEGAPQQQVIYVPHPGPDAQYNQQPPMQYNQQPPMQYGQQAPMQYTQQPPMQAPGAQYTEQAPGMQYTQQPPFEPSSKAGV